MSKKIKSFKGFDENLKCRDFQYEVGKTYEHDGDVKACASGFHACEHPFDVFAYYEPNKSRYAIVTQSGDTSKDGDDSKVSSAKITIEAELCLSEFIESGVQHIISKCTKLKTTFSKKKNGLASNSGCSGAASNSGDYGAAMNAAYKGRVKGVEGTAMFLVERDDNLKAINVWSGIVGQSGVKADVWYTLKNGELMEVAA